jgi:hypothetical protein
MGRQARMPRRRKELLLQVKELHLPQQPKQQHLAGKQRKAQ